MIVTSNLPKYQRDEQKVTVEYCVDSYVFKAVKRHKAEEGRSDA